MDMGEGEGERGRLLFYLFIYFTLIHSLYTVVLLQSSPAVLKTKRHNKTHFLAEEEKDAVSDEDRKETSPEVLEAQFTGK